MTIGGTSASSCWRCGADPRGCCHGGGAGRAAAAAVDDDDDNDDDDGKTDPGCDPGAGRAWSIVSSPRLNAPERSRRPETRELRRRCWSSPSRSGGVNLEWPSVSSALVVCSTPWSSAPIPLVLTACRSVRSSRAVSRA